MKSNLFISNQNYDSEIKLCESKIKTEAYFKTRKFISRNVKTENDCQQKSHSLQLYQNRVYTMVQIR